MNSAVRTLACVVLALRGGVSQASETSLLELKPSSELSRKMGAYRNQGFESAGGAWVSFQPLYRPRWRDVGATWMTQLHPSWGLIWGLSTGERGAKYTISPGLKLGLVFRQPLGLHASWSVRATVIAGGRLKERSCLADYGDIGGEQEVNCRLSATTLEPAETLRYLFDEKPPHRQELLVSYQAAF